MKKIIRLTESELIKIVQQVIKEQDDSEGDATECLKQYINFFFQFTEYDKEGSPVDGGDLGLWNNNIIPNPNNKLQFEKLKYTKLCISVINNTCCTHKNK